MTEDQMRHIPYNCEHSITWTIWHIAHIEDIAMNLLVADDQQIFFIENWSDRLNISLRDSGNTQEAMTPKERAFGG